jgi:hypothetical protein
MNVAINKAAQIHALGFRAPVDARAATGFGAGGADTMGARFTALAWIFFGATFDTT